LPHGTDSRKAKQPRGPGKQKKPGSEWTRAQNSSIGGAPPAKTGTGDDTRQRSRSTEKTKREKAMYSCQDATGSVGKKNHASTVKGPVKS